jgi:hypothetical protein
MATKLNPVLIAFIAGAMTSAGFTLESLDADSVGKDDVAGMLLISGADVLTGFTQSNDSKFDKGMIAINSMSANYLKSRGIHPAN